MSIRALLATTIVGLVVPAADAAAAGSTASVSGGTLTVTANSGFANSLTIAPVNGGAWSVTDLAGVDATAPGCVAAGSQTAVCGLIAGINTIDVATGDGNDQANIVDSGPFGPASMPITASADGGTGSDTLNNFHVITGGDGNDIITGAASGSTTLYGGAGNDTLQAQAPGNLYGGTGDDDLVGSRFGDGLYGEENNDDLAGGDGDDTLGGWTGHDVMDGGAGDDDLVGHDGNDWLVGGADVDELFGYAGNDTINAEDGPVGWPDTVHCGTEVDVAQADPIDSVNSDCETVHVL